MNPYDVGKCTSCRRPLGTGTLLDLKPNPPADAPGFSLEDWRRFAVRYRCPVCALWLHLEREFEHPPHAR